VSSFPLGFGFRLKISQEDNTPLSLFTHKILHQQGGAENTEENSDFQRNIEMV
jgi:hypothetical protein